MNGSILIKDVCPCDSDPEQMTLAKLQLISHLHIKINYANSFEKYALALMLP